MHVLLLLVLNYLLLVLLGRKLRGVLGLGDGVAREGVSLPQMLRRRRRGLLHGWYV